MAEFHTLTSSVVYLPVDDVDTDQIIPAQFLKVTDKSGLGTNLFFAWRYQPDGSLRPDFVLNQPAARDARVLFAGRNFGCGSSREHAPWALTGYGFRAVIAGSFADIFRNNALKNGLLPVILEPEMHAALAAQLHANPQTQVSIDLETQTVTFPDGTGGFRQAAFPIDSFSKTCLLRGVDELGYLLGFETQIQAYERQT